MKNKLNFTIQLPIYPTKIIVSFGETDQQVFSCLDKNGIELENPDIIKMNGVGRFCIFAKGGCLIRMSIYPKYPEDYGTLAHEIFHAVTFILDSMGISLQLGVSDEAYSYLIGYITKEIYLKL